MSGRLQLRAKPRNQLSEAFENLGLIANGELRFIIARNVEEIAPGLASGNTWLGDT